MEKQEQGRLIIALVLCFAVVFGWQFFFAPSQDEQAEQARKAAEAEQKSAALSQPTPGMDAPAGTVQAEAENFIPSTGKTITVTTPLYTASFTSQGGVLESFLLKKYKQTLDPDSPEVDLVGPLAAPKGPLGVILSKGATEIHTWIKGQWAYEGQESTVIEGKDTTTLLFTGMVSGFKIERSLTFHADNYLIEENVVVTNVSDTGIEGALSFTSAMEMPSPDSKGYNRYNLPRVTSLSNDGFNEIENRDDLAKEGYSVTGDLKWGSLRDGYFMSAIMPDSPDTTLYSNVAKGEDADVFRMAVVTKETFLPNVAKTLKVSYFMGPVLKDYLAGMPNDLSKAVNFGFFDILAKPLLLALNFLEGYVGNYGIAIILLTILIKLAFWPLSQKSYQSMEQMKKLQPMVAKLREKYGDDKQKLNQETMALYKTYKVNPMGGCLPMALQIPVFFGLYKALLGAVELRHAPFITHLPFTDMPWLADLSAMDPYYITPVIMGVTMLLQQLMTPSTGDPMQKKIMMIMPVVFTYMFLWFPSGLVVYWLVNNVLSIAQQMMIAKATRKAA